MMLKFVLRSSRRLLRMVLSSLLGAFVVLIIVMVSMLNNRPDLEIWHTLELENEFRAELNLQNFHEYLELENRLFEELDQEIYQKADTKNRLSVIRYHPNSLSDPSRWPTNWNRTFVLSSDQPTVRVLLLHGMSDSPYSMRSIGQALNARGASVIGLRVPGHGQLPSGLLDVEWQDMTAAVKLAIGRLSQESADSPMYIVGYSNGGALAVQYALESLGDDKLPRLDGLVLMSPEIGISKLAALAIWQERLGHLLGLEKLAWNGLLPEYDPWKYGSFALNAGKQAYEITQEIQKQITRHEKAGNLSQMPPILAFQSVVDATITAPALVNDLFRRLPPIETHTDVERGGEHQLELFDINRYAEIEPLLTDDPADWVNPVLNDPNLGFRLTLVSNKNRADEQIIATGKSPGSTVVNVCETGMYWPQDIYSLSHVALPFPIDDPVYGRGGADNSPGIYLGNLALRGERNVLQVTPADMLRLRSNPLYAYMQGRMMVFMGLDDYPGETCMLGASD